MLDAIHELIGQQGLWLLLLWILREVMGVVWQEYWRSRVSWPSNSDDQGPQAMLVEATIIIVLEGLLFGVTILAFLLWMSVVKLRRELGLQSRPPGQIAEGEKPSTATSTSAKCLEATSTTAKHSRNSSPRRRDSERASSEHSIANADEDTSTGSLIATLDSHISVEPSQTLRKMVSVSSDRIALAKDAQSNHTKSTLDSNLLMGSSIDNPKESLSRVFEKQSSRSRITTTSNNRDSRADRSFGTNRSLEGSGQRNKRRHFTNDPSKSSQEGNGGQNQSSKRTRTKTGRSGGNASKEREQAGRGQMFGTKGNAGKNNRRKEPIGQPQHQHDMFNQPGYCGMPSTAPQQLQPTSPFVFPLHTASQNAWSNGQFREPPMVPDCYRKERVYPQVISPQQLYPGHPFGQPTDRGFMSGYNWTHNNSRPHTVEASDQLRIVNSETRIVSPTSYTLPTTPQWSMGSQAHLSVASIATTTTSTAAQDSKLISDAVELQYSPIALSARESFESSIEAEFSSPKPTVGHCRSKSIPKVYNIDLEQGGKALNRALTFPQGDESHICWRAFEQPYCEEQYD